MFFSEYIRSIHVLKDFHEEDNAVKKNWIILFSLLVLVFKVLVTSYKRVIFKLIVLN